MLRSISNTWLILDTFTVAQPIRTIRECASISGLTKSSTYRLLRSLEETGLVERADVGWRLGPRVVDLATRRLANLDPRRDVAPRLSALGRREWVAGALSIPGGDEVGVSGRAILLSLPQEERLVYLTSVEWNELSPERRAELLKELEDASQRGYALQRGESIPGVAGIGVPLHDPMGRPVRHRREHRTVRSGSPRPGRVDDRPADEHLPGGACARTAAVLRASRIASVSTYGSKRRRRRPAIVNRRKPRAGALCKASDGRWTRNRSAVNTPMRSTPLRQAPRSIRGPQVSQPSLRSVAR